MNATSLTQREAASRLRITARQLRALTGARVISRDPDGLYPWPKIREEHRAHLKAQSRRRDAGYGDAPYRAARARKIGAQARLTELAVAVREGQLITVQEHLDCLRRVLTGLNAQLSAVPGRYPPQITGIKTLPEAQSVLREIVNDIKTRMRNDFDEVFGNVHGRPDDDRAA